MFLSRQSDGLLYVKLLEPSILSIRHWCCEPRCHTHRFRWWPNGAPRAPGRRGIGPVEDAPRGTQGDRRLAGGHHARPTADRQELDSLEKMAGDGETARGGRPGGSDVASPQPAARHGELPKYSPPMPRPPTGDLGCGAAHSNASVVASSRIDSSTAEALREAARRKAVKASLLTLRRMPLVA